MFARAGPLPIARIIPGGQAPPHTGNPATTAAARTCADYQKLPLGDHVCIWIDGDNLADAAGKRDCHGALDRIPNLGRARPC